MEKQIYKTGIIAGVIGSIIVIVFIKPIINLCWAAMYWLSLHAHKSFSDSIYQNAALGQRDWVIVLLSSALSFLAINFLVGILCGIVIFKIRSKKRSTKKPSKKKLIIYKICICILSVCASFLLICATMFVIYDLQLNTSFNQRLNILAPVISDQEYKELKASWALMESRGDYEAIVNEMEEMARDKGVSLPKLLLK